MPVLLTQDEINTFEKNGVSSDDIQYTVDYYRSNGISDDDIRTKIDDKLNSYYNNYAREITSLKSRKNQLKLVLH